MNRYVGQGTKKRSFEWIMRTRWSKVRWRYILYSFVKSSTCFWSAPNSRKVIANMSTSVLSIKLNGGFKLVILQSTTYGVDVSVTEVLLEAWQYFEIMFYHRSPKVCSHTVQFEKVFDIMDANDIIKMCSDKQVIQITVGIWHHCQWSRVKTRANLRDISMAITKERNNIKNTYVLKKYII